MDNAELKLISASNIINLRKSAGMTQSDLGALLSYSDKTVSKWERGEAIPDACVLVQLAKHFGVTVDYLLSSHDSWESPEEKEKKGEPLYSADIIIAITLLGVMTTALAAFVICWTAFSIIEWRIFLLGLTITAIVYLVLDCVFKKAKHLRWALIVLIVLLFLMAYFVFMDKNLWQLFLLLIPAIAIAVLSTKVKKKPKIVHEEAQITADS